MRYVLLLGRVLFSLIFILKSLEHFSSQAIQHAVHMGVRAAPLFVPIAGILALLGGLSVLLGYKARIGAWLLVIFLVPTTFMMHQFWGSTEGPMIMMQQFCFYKNISLIGACLMIAYFGSGPCSLTKEKKGKKG